MTSVFDTMTPNHDPKLVLLAAMICVFGALSTMNVAARAAGPQRRALWLPLLSICAAATVWATHFIAMLAYRQGTPTTYDPWLTALSFLAGMTVMGLGFGTAVHGRDDQRMRFAGGAVVGVGVVALHYIGMGAVRLPGEMTYAPALVATSVLLSILFGALSLDVALGPSRASARPMGALLMTAMILSLHFTAMRAVHMHEGMAAPGAGGGLTRTILAAAVATASISVLLIAIVGSLIDQRVSRRLAAEAERFRTLAEGAFEGLIVHRDGVVMDANATARQLLGLEDGASGRSLAACFGPGLDLGSPAPTEGPVEVLLRRPDGSQFPAEVCRRRIQLSDGRDGELCAVRDLTVRKESEARIAHLALHDSLTDLPNRRFFMELAQKVMSRATRTRTPFALLTLDLDDFKIVNDTHGHTSGDDVIRAVAQRISSSLRDSDVAARFGGDEFAVLQLGVSQPGQAMALADRLLAKLQAPVELAFGEVLVSASIGIAIHPDDGLSIEDLLRNADTAMYRAKADGKSMVCFFEPHMEAALVARRSLEQGLRRAVAEKRFSVAYQPIVESRTREPIGFEALVRWHDNERGTVMPADFIPVAEETGLIVPIGEFVVRQACKDAMSWPDDLRVAVNLSAVQFRRQGLVDTIRRALEESGLPGHRLELEITETLLVDNRQDALHVLNALKDLGVRISMDDFGTGYSALSYLQSFPFDKIKIDRVFVADLGCNPQNASIVRAVAAMGRSLEMRVVAEGVETDSEAVILEGLDCDEIQGYLIARPMPASEVEQFLSDHAQGLAEYESAFTGPRLAPRASA